ncbi:MAG: MFS transporter [Pseudomonadota bacterium]
MSRLTDLGQRLRQDRSLLSRYSAVLGLQLGAFLPISFVVLMLPIVFREQGLPLSHFWVFAVPSIPVWLRPLWAPLIDRYGSERLGRRKSWFLPCTIFGAAAYLLMAQLQPVPENLALIITALTITTAIMTTQDIAVDGYMIENIAPAERPAAAAALDICRNLAMFLAWGVLVIIYGSAGWTTAVATAAGLLLLFSLPAILRREPPRPENAVADPSLRKLLVRADARRVLLICLVLGFAGGLLVSLYPTMLIDKGFSASEVAVIAGSATLFGTVIGATLTAIFMRYCGYRRTLGASVGIVLLGFLPLAWLGAQSAPSGLIVFLITLNALALPSFLDVAFQAVRLQWTSEAQAGTEYTTQVVLTRAGFSLATAVAGPLAALVGWSAYFLIAGPVVSLAAAFLWWQYPQVERLVAEREEQETAEATASGGAQELQDSWEQPTRVRAQSGRSAA